MPRFSFVQYGKESRAQDTTSVIVVYPITHNRKVKVQIVGQRLRTAIMKADFPLDGAVLTGLDGEQDLLVFQGGLHFAGATEGIQKTPRRRHGDKYPTGDTFPALKFAL